MSWSEFMVSPRAARWRHFAGAVVIVLAGVAAYWRSLDTPFVFDDWPGIVDNTSIRDLSRLDVVLNPPAEGAGIDSRPIINLSMALNYAAGGLEPWGYHVANVALHLAGALTLLGLLRRLLVSPAVPERWRAAGEPVAFWSALLWAVHPLQSETVICVIQRTESMVSLFYLLTLLTFVRAATAGTPRARRAWSVAMVVACLLGMGPKEVMVSAPLAVWLCDRTFFSGTFAAAWRRRRGTYVALAATWLLLALLVLSSGGDRGGTSGFGQGVSAWTYLLTQSHAILLYLRMVLWPHPLIIDHGTWLAPGFGAVAPQFFILAALFGVTVWAVIRNRPAGFAGAIFFMVLAPSSSVYPLVSQTIAEHRMHLALAPVLVLLVATIGRWGRRVLPVVGGLAALAAAGATAVRCGDFTTEQRLWERTVQDAPENGWAHFNLARALARQDRWIEAETANREAVRLLPNDPAARYALALSIDRQGRAAEAVAQYQRAVELRPDYAEAHARGGFLLLTLGRPQEAVGWLERAWALDPKQADAAGNLGAACYQLGRKAEAVTWFGRVIALRPDAVDAYYNLGLVQAELGRWSEAAAALAEAARRQPGNAEVQQRWREAQARAEAGR